MKLEDIEATFDLAIGELTLLGQGARIEAWAQFHGRKLLAVAKAANKLQSITTNSNKPPTEWYEMLRALQELENE